MGLAAEELRRASIKEPRGLDRLVDSMRKDYQFQLAERTLRSLVEAVTVSIEVDGDEKAQALADNLTKRWKESRPKSLEAIAFGRQLFERWYEWDATAEMMFVAPMTAVPFSHSEICIDPDDGAIGAKVKGKGDSIPLEPDRVWWFALDPTEIEPHGRSRFLGAPLEVWKDRRTLEKQGDVWRSRYALGTGVIYAPSEYPKTPIKGAGVANEIDVNGRPTDPLEDAQAMVENKQSGGFFVLPSESDASGKPFWRVEQLPEVEDAAALANELKRLDDAALSSMGIPPRAITQDSSVGSLAMSQTHLEVLQNTVQGILFQIVASFQKNIIDPAVQINWPEGSRPTLTLTPQPVGEALRIIINQAVQQIMAAPAVSPLISSGVIDLARMLEIAGVPTGQDIPQKLAAIQQQAATAAAAIPSPGIPQRPFGMATKATDPPPADAVSPEEIFDKSQDEMKSLWPRLTRALANRAAMPRGTL
jgi:hypothetical protein